MNDIVCTVEEKDGEFFVDNKRISDYCVTNLVREYDRFKQSISSLENLLEQKQSQAKELTNVYNKMDIGEDECISFMKKAGKDLEALKNKPSENTVRRITEKWRMSGYTKHRALRRENLIDLIKDNIKYVMEQENTMKQLTSSLQKIKEEISTLEAKISRANEYMKEVQTQNGSLIEIILEYETKKVTHGNNPAIKNQIKELRQECVRVMTKYRRETQSDVNNEVEALHEKIDTLDTDLRDANNEINAMKADMQYLISTNESIKKEKQEVVDIASTILNTITAIMEDTKNTVIGQKLYSQMNELVTKLSV